MCKGCVTPQTVVWLQQVLLRLPPAPMAAAFVHIPLPEFIRAWNRGSQVQGAKGELTCCPSCNSGVARLLQCAPTHIASHVCARYLCLQLDTST